jgi:hypothetical protein
MEIIEKLQNLIKSTETYLESESSKTYDTEEFRAQLKGEIWGYKTALDLMKKEGK